MVVVVQCASCGGRGGRRDGGHYVCSYCGQPVLPRLAAGTVCGDEIDGRACRALAESLCVGCGLPLCTRHNDPERYYWHETLSWRTLCPGWSEADGAAWHRVQQRLPSLPLPDFAPFPWVHHDREALYAVGLLEDEIGAALRPLVREIGGDLDGEAAAFDNVCTQCESRTIGRLREITRSFAVRYRLAAFAGRLAALERELEQATRYVDAWLKRPARPAEPARGAWPLLDADSPREDWEIWSATLRLRREEVDRLTRAL